MSAQAAARKTLVTLACKNPGCSNTKTVSADQVSRGASPFCWSCVARFRAQRYYGTSGRKHAELSARAAALAATPARKEPSSPTGHAPGSPGKIEVMRARYLAGEHIHHPRDAGVRATATRTALWLEAVREDAR